ncbi:MAG: sulfatase [Nitrospirae bacterium]|nr:sulfatase [Nitrospirota bacterium]
MAFFQSKNTGVSAGKSLLTVFRILFVLLSVHFFLNIFVNKWGGYSYYMSFFDFLPDLSLAYILWIVMVFAITLVVWLMTYCVAKLLPVSLQVVRFEHLFGGLLIAVLLRMAKRIFFKDVYLSELTGLNNLTLLIIFILLVVCIVLIIKNVINRLLYGLENGISLLVWFFALLIIAALPLSFISKIDYDSQSVPVVNCTDISNPLIPPSMNNRFASYPNIILVTMDSLTSMDMQSYGYNRPTTPFISKWSKDAIVFKEAYSSSNWSPPSVMSIMTGQRVWTHGVWHRTEIFPVKKYEQNFPNLLKDNGYDVFGFVQTTYLHPVSLGIGESFSVKVRPQSMWIPKTWWFDKLSMLFMERPIAREMVFESNTIAQLIIRFRPDIHVIETPSEAVYSGFLDCISQYEPGNRNRPFFAWLHVLPPHYPYLPPAPYLGFFGDEGKFVSNNEQELININKEYSDEMQPDVDILRKRYDELILYSDRQFELFMSRLSERIDMSNTIIILSADHGESFSNGFRGHVYEHLYEQLVRVPLIVKLSEEGKGKEIDVPVESIDIAPTILKLAGIPAPGWMEGRVLLPSLEGEELEIKPIFTMQFNENRSLGHLLTKGAVAVRERNYKLIYYMESGKKLLFDLGKDPHETKDISDDEPLITAHLMELIRDNLSKANKKITASSFNK